MKLNELYFGVKLYPLSWSNKAEHHQLETYNLFDLSRIKESIAIYRTMSEEVKKDLSDPLFFCFGDVWSRCEYEMIVCPWPYAEGEGVEDNGIKVDLFEMYVLPNRRHLLDLIESVDEKDCKKFLSELRKRRKR